MIQNLLIGSSGLVGSAVLCQLITKNFNFVILDRLNPNCLREIADQKIRLINIINCAFNFKNINNNYDFINFLFDTLKKNNIKINTYINISSVNAFSDDSGKFSFNQIKVLGASEVAIPLGGSCKQLIFDNCESVSAHYIIAQNIVYKIQDKQGALSL